MEQLTGLIQVAVGVSVAAAAVLFFWAMGRLTGAGERRDAREIDFDLAGCAEQLGARIGPPVRPAEVATLNGTGPKGISWTLRVMDARDPDSDDLIDQHYLFWHTTVESSGNLLLVLGDEPKDRILQQWMLQQGLTPREYDQLEQTAHASADQMLDLMKEYDRDPRFRGQNVAELAAAEVRVDAPGHSMTNFVRFAQRLALPPDLEGVYQGFTIDDAVAGQVFTSEVEHVLQQWRAERGRIGNNHLRLWIREHDVRVEAAIADPAYEHYRLVVELGLALARTRQSEPHI